MVDGRSNNALSAAGLQQQSHRLLQVNPPSGVGHLALDPAAARLHKSGSLCPIREVKLSSLISVFQLYIITPVTVAPASSEMTGTPWPQHRISAASVLCCCLGIANADGTGCTGLRLCSAAPCTNTACDYLLTNTLSCRCHAIMFACLFKSGFCCW